MLRMTQLGKSQMDQSDSSKAMGQVRTYGAIAVQGHGDLRGARAIYRLARESTELRKEARDPGAPEVQPRQRRVIASKVEQPSRSTLRRCKIPGFPRLSPC